MSILPVTVTVTVAEMSVARRYVSSIGTLSRSFHTAINNAGQIVGRVNMSSTSNDWHGTIWNGASLTGNRTLGTNHDDANAINDAGQVAGSNAYHATIWNGATATTLGSGTVLAINNNGKAAGAAMYSGGIEPASRRNKISTVRTQQSKATCYANSTV